MFILILSDSEWFRLKLIEIEYIHGNLKSKTVRSWQSSEPINCLLICLQTWKVFLLSFRLIPIIFNQFIWNSRNSWISKKNWSLMFIYHWSTDIVSQVYFLEQHAYSHELNQHRFIGHHHLIILFWVLDINTVGLGRSLPFKWGL